MIERLNIRTGIGLGMATAFGLLLGACETVPMVGEGASPPSAEPAPIAAAEVTVPPTFLSTVYEPLDNWLDKRFKVEYRNMKPAVIFKQEPINEIKYKTHALPAAAPMFKLNSPSISRREILYRVSEFWDLEMTIESVNGTPSFVKVTGKDYVPSEEAIEEPETPEAAEPVDVGGSLTGTLDTRPPAP